MQCEACGSVNPEVNSFCQGCGAPLGRNCVACGHANGPGAAYCGACGAELAAAKPTTQDSPAQRRHLAQGELKHVTVLFVDLVRSTEMVASLDAESAMHRLQPVLQAMRDTVERFGGTVMRTLGDGIMALFGAPRALEGHAVLACQSALAIRDALSLQAEGLAVRAGLHSGEVVADTLLNGPLSEAGSYGMTLHLGSRLAAEVEPDEICISEACYHLVRAYCEVRSLGHRTLRGVPAPVGLYALVGMKAAAASEQFRDVTLTSFVGRHKEISELKSALRATEAGAGRIVGIVGAPGTGKSRLCYEFAEFCRGRPTPVFEVRAQTYGAVTPLQPVLDLLRLAYFGIEPNDQPMTAVETIGARLAEIDTTAEGDLPLICDFLGIAWRDGAPTWLSPKARTTRLLEILQSLVRLRGAEISVVIIEDLHWLDEASEAFVAALAQAVVGTRTMLVVNCRPGYSKPWMRASNYHQIELTELDHRNTDRLVDELIGPHPELTEVRQLIAARSGGNPFFVEELVRSLIDNGVVVGKRGAYRRGDEAVMAALPATVQAVIGARIDHLPPEDRELLQIGAIIGKEFQSSVLQSVAGLEPAVMEATLGRLCAAGLLHRNKASEGREYSFRHPLIQEVAYATQLRLRRGPLHMAVARAMEHFHRDRGDEFAALIAYHLEEAGEVNRAAFYAARAARWIGQTSSAPAMKHWQKVRTLMAGQPRSRENDALRIQASAQIAWLGWREGLTATQAKPFVQEALAWASEIDDSMIPLLLLVDGRMAQVSGGKSDAFVQQLWRAIALAEAKGDAGRVATLHASLSHAYGWAGRLREALVASDAALARVAAVSDFDHQFLGYSVEHWTISLRGRILLRLGRFDEARKCFDHIIGINILIDPTVLFVAHFGYVDLAWCLDDVAMATVHAGRIATLAARHGSAYLKFYQMTSQAIAAAIAGEFGQAIQGVTDSLEFLRQTGAAIEYEPELLASLADYLMRTGELAQAVAMAEEAVALARERDARLPECRAKITLSSLAVMMKGGAARAEAEGLIGDAERLIAESGAMIYQRRLDEARNLLGAAVRRRGDGAPAA
jgi:adenylate cyclase